MKIHKLYAENVKRLVAVEITPDGNVVVISGKNGAGKSSVLDSILYAIGGGAAFRGTPKPIRDGQHRAEIRLEIAGDDGAMKYVVTRSMVEGKTSTLKIENADGFQAKSPQALLDELVGDFTFDPLEFMRLAEKEQLAALLALVELPFEPAEIEERRRRTFDLRRDVGREIRDLEGQIAGFPDPDPTLPTEEVSTAALHEEFRAAQRAHEDNAARKSSIERADAAVERLRTELDEAIAYRQALPEPADAASLPDPAAIEARFATLDATNARVRERQKELAVERRLDALRRDHVELTATLTAIEDEKAAGIRAAKMPVEGLAFDDSGVTYGGVPIKQASAAEQLRVSVAIAMALNPKLRVIRITDGSLLDSSNFALIEAMAEANDFQVWVEVVDESGRVGVVIEDGAVAAS